MAGKPAHYYFKQLKETNRRTIGHRMYINAGSCYKIWGIYLNNGRYMDNKCLRVVDLMPNLSQMVYSSVKTQQLQLQRVNKYVWFVLQ